MIEETGPIKRMFWDIETSPNLVLSWRVGYNINLQPENIVRERGIISISWKMQGKDKTHHLAWDKGDDKAMIQQFIGIASDCDELVAHNGNAFDLKWLKGRALIHGLPMIPLPKTVDTLLVARKHFKLNSNKLDYIAMILLGEGKNPTNYAMWKSIMMDNCPIAMEQMLEYGDRDVLLLERVYDKLSPYMTVSTHMGVQLGNPRWSCAHCGDLSVRRKRLNRSGKGVISHQMYCANCSRYYTINNLVYGWYEQGEAGPDA